MCKELNRHIDDRIGSDQAHANVIYISKNFSYGHDVKMAIEMMTILALPKPTTLPRDKEGNRDPTDQAIRQ